jgi:hypothetical protein
LRAENRLVAAGGDDEVGQVGLDPFALLVGEGAPLELDDGLEDLLVVMLGLWWVGDGGLRACERRRRRRDPAALPIPWSHRPLPVFLTCSA